MRPSARARRGRQAPRVACSVCRRCRAAPSRAMSSSRTATTTGSSSSRRRSTSSGSFPRPGDVRPGQSFHDPDDAFFTPGYRAISINEEFNETASLVDVRTHRIFWTYGHAGVAGSSFGYLSNPDDAYLLRNGLLMVADIKNCRVLFVNRAKQVVREIGHAGSCSHDPPRGLSSPNGATPLRTAACSSRRSAAGSTGSTRPATCCTRCARRRRTLRTRSCSRAATSSSRASTRRAASTS